MEGRVPPPQHREDAGSIESVAVAAASAATTGSVASVTVGAASALNARTVGLVLKRTWGFGEVRLRKRPPTNSITPLQTRTLYRYNMYSHTYWVSQLFQGRNTCSANFSKATKPSKARFEKEVRKGFRAAQSKHGGGIRRQAPGISSNVNCSGTIRRNRLTQRRSVISLDSHDLPECACLSLLRSVLDPRIVHVPRQSFANLE